MYVCIYFLQLYFLQFPKWVYKIGLKNGSKIIDRVNYGKSKQSNSTDFQIDCQAEVSILCKRIFPANVLI